MGKIGATNCSKGDWTVGFVAPNIHGYFFGSLLTGVRDAAAARGGRVIAIQTHDAGISVFEDELFTAQVAWGNIDALVVAQAAVGDEYLHQFVSTGRPVVTVYQEPDAFPCPVVIPDNQQGVRGAVGHLLEHGHRDIAFVGRDPANADDWIRYRAYRETMLEHGLQPSEAVLVPWQLDETYHATAALQQLRGRGRLPTAVMACTDVTAMALIRALDQAGIAVPDDIAVIGFDDISDAADCQPPLSTVAQSFALAGTTACELVFDALEGRPIEPGPHCTPVTLVVRESCGCRAPAVESVEASATSADLPGRFAAEVAGALSGEQELTRARQRDLLAIGDHLVRHCGGYARRPDTDPAAALDTVVAALRPLLAGTPNLARMMGPMLGLARSVADDVAPGDVVTAARVERLVFDLAGRLLENHRCGHGQAVVNQHVEIQRRYNMISTELVRYDGDFRSLSWLAGTEVRAGCLALWEDGRGNPDGTSTLRIVGTHGDAGAAGPDPCRVQAFPPPRFVAGSAEHPDDLVFVLPVRFNGSDWGFLALAGPFDGYDEMVFERFNHWAVLLTVSLDQEQALRSERALLREIRASEERYAIAAEAANDGLWDWDRVTGTVFYSGRWKAMLGYADDAIDGSPGEWLGRIHPDDRTAVELAIAAQLDGRVPTLEVEYRLRAADGTYRWVLTHGRAVRNEAGRAVRLVGSMTDITDRKRMEEQLRRDAQYDLLTGVPNRVLFLDRLNQAVMRSRQVPDYAFAVVFLDLDGFKAINDSLGHQAGDEVLIQVADRLAGQLRAGDTVARFGGDEFVLLLEDVRDMAEVPAIVDRVLAAIAAPLTLAGRTRLAGGGVAVSAAAGVTLGAGAAVGGGAAGRRYRGADEYLRDADAAMYRAKAIGPGTVVVFDDSMRGGTARPHFDPALDRTQTLERAVAALQQGQPAPRA